MFRSKRRQKAGALLIVVCFVMIAVSTGLFRAHKQRQAHARQIIPRTIAQQALFPLYAPAKLPKGAWIDSTSFRYRDQAVIFSIRTQDAHTVAVSEQAKPPAFDFGGFYQQQLSNNKRLPGTPHTSVLGKLKDRPTRILSITTDSTWLLVSAPEAVRESDLALIAQKLTLQD